MASRLSEQSLLEAYDQGQKAFYIEGLSSDQAAHQGDPRGDSPQESSRYGNIGQGVDLDQLLSLENPEEAVQGVHAQELYHAIMVRGPEESLEVLQLLSQDQLVRFFDYDVWSKDSLEPLKIVRWLEIFGELGPEELVKKFRELDEEYQTAFIGPLIRLVDEDEYEDLSDQEQDRFQALPCGQLHYCLETENPRLISALEALIQAALGQDINYAYALLTHGAYLPPHEQEQTLMQMRQARLEEDGFLTFEESTRFFLPLSPQEQALYLPKSLMGALQSLTESSGSSPLKEGFPPPLPQRSGVMSGSFLEEIFSRLEGSDREQARHQLLTLANALCSAAQVEPDDIKGAEIVLAHGQAITNLGLQWISDGDPQLAARFFLSKGPQVAFRTGISLCHQYAVYTLQALISAGLPGAKAIYNDYRACKYGLALTKIETSWLSILGYERVEWLKGLLNRFPLRLSHPKQYEGGAAGSGKDTSSKSSAILVFQPIYSIEILRALAVEVYVFAGVLFAVQKLDPNNQIKDRSSSMIPLESIVNNAFNAVPPHQSALKLLESVREDLSHAWNGQKEGGWWQPPMWEKPLGAQSQGIIAAVLEEIIGLKQGLSHLSTKQRDGSLH